MHLCFKAELPNASYIGRYCRFFTFPIPKVHGGITDQDVKKFVEYAEKQAKINKSIDSNMSTVAFFDEANTTESIGLIKEIMCDWRMNGRPVSRDLKFIAACNPYRR